MRLSLFLVSGAVFCSSLSSYAGIDELRELSRFVALHPNETLIDRKKDRIFSHFEEEQFRSGKKITHVSIQLVEKILRYKNFVFISGGPNPKWEKDIDSKIITDRTATFEHRLNEQKMAYFEIEGQYSSLRERSFMVILSDHPSERSKEISFLEAEAFKMKQDSVVETLNPGLYALKFLQKYEREPDISNRFYIGVSYKTFEKEPKDDYSKFIFDDKTIENVYFSINFFFDLGPYDSYPAVQSHLRHINLEGLKDFTILKDSDVKAAEELVKATGKESPSALQKEAHTTAVPTGQENPFFSGKPLLIITRGSDLYTNLALRTAALLEAGYKKDEIVVIGTDAHIDQINKEIKDHSVPNLWSQYIRPEFIKRNSLLIEMSMIQGKKVIIFADMTKNVKFAPVELALKHGYSPLIIRWQDSNQVQIFSHLEFMERHTRELLAFGDFEAPYVNIDGTAVPQYHESTFNSLFSKFIESKK